jgi:hypothetical protein
MRVRRIVACVVAIAGLACRERSTTTVVKPDDSATVKSAKPPPKNGRIVGKVHWDGAMPMPMPPAGVSSATGACASVRVANPVVGVGGGLADTIVRVMPETLPPSPAIASSVKTVTAKGCVFEPTAAIVATKQEIAIENEDPMVLEAHGYDFDNAESIFDFKVWPRASGTVNLETTAPLVDVILVMSDDHPWMRAVVFVADPQWSRITTKTGSFTIDDVPPGEHDVQAFHDGGDAMRWQIRHVVVPDDGTDVRVDFTYPRK